MIHHVDKYPIYSIFDRDAKFYYFIPKYQRAYTWSYSKIAVIDLFTKKSKTRPSDLTASEMGSKSEYPTIGAISHIGGVTF